MGKLYLISVCLVLLIVCHVDSVPNRRIDTGNSKLASVLSDYWSQRGFHDASDPLMASESQGKELLSGDDDVREGTKGKSKILIPNPRMVPPGLAAKQNSMMNKIAGKIRQQKERLMGYRYPRVRLMNKLTPTAQRKQDDMEILESVTLMDGGTPQSDGTIRRERVYQPGPVYEQEQMSPLSYRLKGDDLNVAYKQYQQQYHQTMESQHQPSFPANYHFSPGEDTQGKLSLGQIKPQYAHRPQPTSLNHYQQQLYAQQQQQGQNLPKPTVIPVFVLPPAHKPLSTQSVISSPQQPPPAAPPALHPLSSQIVSTVAPPPSPSPDPTPVQQNPQAFEQQFQHPFNAPSSLPSTLSSLAQLTSAILAGASSVAAATSAATSAAATALAKETVPSSSAQSTPPFSFASAFQSAVESELFPKYALPNTPHVAQQAPSQASFGPLVSGLLSAASIPSASQTYLPPPLTPFNAASTSRPGVISDYEQLAPNQLTGDQENLVTRISRLVETGKKILYFPKGVIDTVDVVLKQMERNPAVAYWGDKFFNKVFGDTSGTK